MKYVIPFALIIVAAILAMGCTAPQTTGTAGSGSDEIVVHALIPLTGGLPQFGESSKAVLQIAESDINQHYAGIGNPTRVRVVYHDTGTDPATARSLAEQIRTNGSKVIIGYLTSAELTAMKPYTDANGMILLATGSSSPSLAIPGDSIYRIVSDDTAQGPAMADWLTREKIRAVVPITRGDVWGVSLTNATLAAFSAEKGVALSGVRYDPGTTDYTSPVSSLDVLTGKAIGTYGADSVGVYAVTFSEIGDIMNAASGKPNLTRVRWFGSNGNTGVSSLSGTAPAARFAAQVNFTGMIWGIPEMGTPGEDPKVRDLVNRLGSEPDGTVLAIYDALFVASMVQEETPPTATPAQLAREVDWVERNFYGVSDDLTPNAAGDRQMPSYDLVRVGTGPAGSQWNRIAQIITYPGEQPDLKFVTQS